MRAEVQFRMCESAWQDGDTLVLCTDGLTNPVKDEAGRSILLDIGPLARRPRRWCSHPKVRPNQLS